MNDNNTTIKKALSDIVVAYGVEVFADVTRVNALLKDFIPQHDKERKLIILALREGLGTELRNYKSIEKGSWKQIITKWEKHLVSDNWITKETAQLVVSQLVEAVGIINSNDGPLNNRENEGIADISRELIKGTYGENENPMEYLPKYQIIGYKAFASNLMLEAISISDTIKIIRSKAFYNCINLQRLELPSSIIEIGRRAFVGCGSLKEIVMSRAEKYTCDSGLLINSESGTLLRAANTEKALRIAIPDNIRTIQEYAFDESKVKQIILPRNLGSIESNAFFRCTALESFEISSTNLSFRCVDGVIYSKDGKILLTYPAGSRRRGYILEDDVIEIAHNAFAGTLNIESITFPSGLLRIGSKAFAGCENIRSILLPISVQSIGERAFQGCAKLKHIMLPRGIKEIGDYAFSECESLETISIPRSVVRIGNCAFSGCKRLRRVVIQDYVSFIGDGAFDGCVKDVEIAVRNNSYVETYCQTRGIAISRIRN